MKQNERLLVYAVTGFLALILVVAVLFSREPGKDTPGANPKSIEELIDGGAQPADKKDKVAADNRTGLPAPGELTPQQPLAAAPKAMLAADLVAQALGPSRRDRTVRFVHVRPNDSLESLVKRWCGARDPWLAETRCLNEELVTLKAGQEIAVPWVDDDVLLAAIEAQKPRTLLAQDAGPAGSGSAAPASATRDGTPSPSPAPALSFAVPGGNSPGGNSNGSTAALGDMLANGAGPVGEPRSGIGAAASGLTYTVKKGDALWSIAARTYGRKNADRMVGEIKAANPGLGDGVREGQKIVLPKATPGA